MNVSLPPELKEWVDQQVKTGGYGTASEYLRDLVRRARERDARRAIDGLLLEAAGAGVTRVMDDADWKNIRAAARAEAVKTSKRKR